MGVPPVPGAPIPRHEAGRLHALAECAVLDTEPEAAFDSLVRIAARSANVPMALISLVDEARQWFKARTGIEIDQTPRDQAFCAHAILEPTALIVKDARDDDRFRDNPLVQGPLNVRFYAGFPLVTHDGHSLGTLCVLDTTPRELSDHQLDDLRDLARQATIQLELRRLAHRHERLEEVLEATLERMVEIASTDPLTGLHNRRGFEECLARAGRYAFAVVVLDIDGLKRVNDEFGHHAGDAVLRGAGAALRAQVRDDDVVARVGGDEFVVVLPGADAAAAAAAAERVREAVATVRGPLGPITASTGWSSAPARSDGTAVWKAADRAMYDAKKSGRGGIAGGPFHSWTPDQSVTAASGHNAGGAAVSLRGDARPGLRAAATQRH